MGKRECQGIKLLTAVNNVFLHQEVWQLLDPWGYKMCVGGGADQFGYNYC